ncbi:hypothetical protein [Streptomyces sp. NPDC015131]|uniref:hypothetical protein n=1 Tax=Streptomyces sp. NPDC015131 TaxID=3364941 RepID=UPI0037032A94
MFLGIGWGSLLILAVVALLVLDPAKVPGVVREVRSFVGTVRSLSARAQADVSEEWRRYAAEAGRAELLEAARAARAECEAAGRTLAEVCAPDVPERSTTPSGPAAGGTTGAGAAPATGREAWRGGAHDDVT